MFTHVRVLSLWIGSSLLSILPENPVRFTTVAADPPSNKTCKIANTENSLEDRLKEVGWKSHSGDFPELDWKTKIAAVVTVTDSYAKPVGIEPTDNGSWAIIHLKSDLNEHNSGVFVFELAPGVKKCKTEYVSAADRLAAVAKHQGRSQGKRSSRSSSSTTTPPPK